MRFSLKWILAAVAYVAIAAAAFSQQSWVYADILWAVSLLTIVFAALMAFLARGKSRAAAAGFLAASICYLACLAFGQITRNDVVPTKRLLIASGYAPNSPWATFTGFPTPTAAFAAPATSSNLWQAAPVASQPLLQAAPAASPYTLSIASPTATIAAAPMPVPVVADFAMYVRAANSVGMMFFGVLGIVVGLFAFKRVSQPNRGD